MDQTATPARKSSRQKPVVTDFVIKEELQDGRVIWINPKNAEEIVMNAGIIPDANSLRILAAHGIVPAVPTLDDYETGAIHREDLDLPPPEEDETAVSRLLSRMKNGPEGTRTEVRIYRIKKDGAESYCGQFSPDDYESGGQEELLRNTFGPGKYRVRIYGPNMREGSNYGKFVRLCNELVEIDSAAVNPAIAGLEGANPVLAQLAQQIQSLNERINAPQTQDQFAQFKQFAELMRTLGNGGPKQQSLMEQLQTLEALRKFQSGLASENKSGDGGKETNMMDLVSQGIQAVQTIVKQQPQVAPIQSVALPESFSQTPAPISELQPQQPEESEDVNSAQGLMLNVFIAALISAAQRNDPVEKHAPGLYNKLPDEALDMLETELWFDLLCETLPPRKAELTQHRSWFEKLRAAIIAEGEKPE